MSRYENVARLAEAYLAREQARDAYEAAQDTLKAAEKTVYLPLRDPFSVEVGGKLVAVEKTSVGFEYSVSTLLSERTD